MTSGAVGSASITVIASAIRGASSRRVAPGVAAVVTSSAVSRCVRASRRPGADLVPGRLARRHVGQAVAVGDSAAWSPAVSVPRSAAISVAYSRLTSPGASEPAGEGLGQRLERVRAVGDELLGHRDRRRCRRADTISAKPARRGTAGKPASSLRNAVISRSGLSPGWSRRYALSRRRSPRTTDVFDWSAPRSRSVPAAISAAPPGTSRGARGPAGKRGRPGSGRARGRRGLGRQGGDRSAPPPSRHARARHAPSPGTASRSGDPVSAKRVALARLRRRA